MKIIKTILLLIAALWISGALAQEPNIVGEAKNLQLLEFRVEAGPVATMMQVVGVARNVGSVAFSNVFIEVNLYDERGVLVGNTIAHGMNLAPGGAWKFSAPATTSFHHAEIAKITAYK
jgi:hypothetical protein